MLDLGVMQTDNVALKPNLIAATIYVLNLKLRVYFSSHIKQIKIFYN